MPSPIPDLRIYRGEMGLSFKNPPGDPDALHVFIKLQFYGTQL